jgi:hypothetical protein
MPSGRADLWQLVRQSQTGGRGSRGSGNDIEFVAWRAPVMITSKFIPL